MTDRRKVAVILAVVMLAWVLLACCGPVTVGPKGSGKWYLTPAATYSDR